MKKFSMGTALVASCCLSAALGAGFAIYLRPASASRNSSGTYSLFTPGNPIVTGTLGNATTMNNTLNDLATEITSSLDRSGRGGMLAALRGIDGTLAAPALSFTSETGSGLWRNGAGDVRMSILGALVGQWTANGLRFANGAVATPGISFVNDTGGGLYRIGSNDFGFAVNGVKSTEWLTTGFLATSASGGPASVWVNAPSATQQARFMMQDQGTDKWGLLKQTDNSLLLFDYVNSRSILSVATGAAAPLVTGVPLTIGASGTAIANAVWGTCTIGVGTTCPITVQSGAKCVCSWTTTTNPCAASVSGTTLTCTNGTVGITCNAICMN